MKGLGLFRLLWRDLRASEVRILAAALVVAVTAVTAVDFFIDRVHRAMERQASELLAADLVVRSTRPLPDEWQQEASRLGLQQASAKSFPNVVFHDERSQLSRVKSVSHSYPLRGELLTQAAADREASVAPGGPPSGEVWVEPRLLDSLDLSLGARIELGDQSMTITRVLRREPDRGADLFQIAPRIMMAEADLASTGLVGPHSRVRYRLMVAGEASAITQFRDYLQSRLDARDQILGLQDNRPEFQSAQQRAERFLGLAAMTAVLLAGAAIALAAQRYRQRQAPAVALLRTLGASSRRILSLHLARLFIIALFSAALGSALGYLLQDALTSALNGVMAAQLPDPRLAPATSGLMVAALATFGFALPQVLGLLAVSPMGVFRQQSGSPRLLAILTAGLALLCFVLLLRWQAGEWTIALYVLAACALALAAAWLLSWLAIALAARARALLGTDKASARSLIWSARFGLGNLHRHRQLNAFLLAAFTLGLSVLLILAIVRADMVRIWQDSLGSDTPNTFLINVQPQQRAPLADSLAKLDIRAPASSSPAFYPMIRGRLISRNGETISVEQFDDPRARSFVNRGWNLSTMAQLPASNRLVAGQWWDSNKPDSPGWSVEQRLANRMGWQIGDRIRFAISGSEIEAPIQSIRQVAWDSFEVNFFVLASPGLLDEGQASFVASFYRPPDNSALLTQLNRQYPTVSAIDLSIIMSQIRTLIDRVSLAVESVFGFTLLAAITILLAGFELSRQSRSQEIGLLRAFGASDRQVLSAALVEYLVLGLLCGLIASAIAQITGSIVASQILDTRYQAASQLWLIGLASGIILVLSAAILPLRQLLKSPPKAVLSRA